MLRASAGRDILSRRSHDDFHQRSPTPGICTVVRARKILREHSEPRLAFNCTVSLGYRIHLERWGYAPATINLWFGASRMRPRMPVS